VLQDGNLITGQNPASSEEAAQKLVEVLTAGQADAAKAA
jgi:putative intracellular protease/amidase